VPGSLTDILPGVAAAFGMAGADDPLGLADELAGARRIAVVLVDGLGAHLLPELARHAPLLAAVVAGEHGRLRELTCTFPSTTPTSLVSFGTGQPPGRHGVLGFRVNVPGTDRVLTHVVWRGEPSPASWQPVPTWFERLASAGIPARVVLPAEFAGSGLTEAAYRGAQFRGFRRGTDYAARFVAEWSAAPGLTYGYHAALDAAAHGFGVASEQWARAAADVDRLLTRLLADRPAGGALLVTADHGVIDIAADARIDLADEPELAAGVRVVAGEPRVRYLHTAAGAAADVAAAWRAVLGDRAEVLERDAAIASGRFGPVPDGHRARIGDVVVTCGPDLAVLATGWEPREVAKLVGFHGASEPAEMAIPLISFAA
jgi:hypothetical protein